jgi:hypothetical protein
VSEYQLSDDAYALATQAAIELKPVEKWKLQAAVDYYYYTDLTPDGESTAFGENSGNATVDTDGNAVADEFLSRFAIIEPSAAVTCEMLPLPVTVSAEYIKNLRGDKDVGSRGYALGGAVGSNQKKGDYRLYYQWQVVEQDAVLSLFSQDDFPRNTNLRGHVFGASFVPADPVLLHAWFLVSRAEDPAPGQSEDYRWRFRFDINVKF